MSAVLVTEPERPKMPTCTNCGHESLHNVGVIGNCYTPDRSGRPCGCYELGWPEESLRIQWEKFSEEYYIWINQQDRRAMIEHFKEIFGDLGVDEEKILKFAEYCS